MEKAKEMYQRKIRFPEDVRKAIEKNGGDECRQFNTELIYQLRKVYGLAGEKSAPKVLRHSHLFEKETSRCIDYLFHPIRLL